MTNKPYAPFTGTHTVSSDNETIVTFMYAEGVQLPDGVEPDRFYNWRGLVEIFVGHPAAPIGETGVSVTIILKGIGTKYYEALRTMLGNAAYDTLFVPASADHHSVGIALTRQEIMTPIGYTRGHVMAPVMLGFIAERMFNGIR